MIEGTDILVPSELFAPAESSSFDGFYELPVLKAGPDLYTFDGPLAWHVDIVNTGGALLVVGTVEGTARATCVRCLGPFDLPVTGEVEGCFILPDAEGSVDGFDDDECEPLPADGIVRLSSLLDAAILLDVPVLPVCDEGCKGLCPRCGADLNEGPCGCDDREAREFDEAANPFAALKDMSFEQGEQDSDAPPSR